MALPEIATPTFECKLPSNGEIIEYRPFLAKEEKILLIAMESNTEKDIVKAIKAIVNSCILSEDLDVENIPTFDLEYLFLKLRAKSVGEVIEIGFKYEDCPEEENKICIQKIKINVDDINVTKDSKHKTKIQLTNNIGVNMRYPTASIVDDIQDTDKESEIELLFNTIANCIESVYTNDKTYPFDDQTKEEKQKFIDSLSSDHLSKISEFFQTMPKLKKKIDYRCQKCNKQITWEVEGITNFFQYA